MRHLVFLICVLAFAAMGLGCLASTEAVALLVQDNQQKVHPEPEQLQPVIAEPQNLVGGANTQTQIQARPSSEQKTGSGAQTIILSRFSFQRVDDGLLRLDTQSGELAHCSPRNGHWSCEIAPENRVDLEKAAKLESELQKTTEKTAALENKNAQLSAEVTRLKAELSEMQATRQSPPPTPPADLSPHTNDGFFKLNIDNSIERMRAAIENGWRRMMSMFTNLQRDLRLYQKHHA
jgi:hypothetical protein